MLIICPDQKFDNKKKHYYHHMLNNNFEIWQPLKLACRGSYNVWVKVNCTVNNYKPNNNWFLHAIFNKENFVQEK